jgi:hypothetical protein
LILKRHTTIEASVTEGLVIVGWADRCSRGSPDMLDPNLSSAAAGILTLGSIAYPRGYLSEGDGCMLALLV